MSGTDAILDQQHLLKQNRDQMLQIDCLKNRVSNLSNDLMEKDDQIEQLKHELKITKDVYDHIISTHCKN